MKFLEAFLSFEILRLLLVDFDLFASEEVCDFAVIRFLCYQHWNIVLFFFFSFEYWCSLSYMVWFNLFFGCLTFAFGDFQRSLLCLLLLEPV
jgi:hypothetical protein